MSPEGLRVNDIIFLEMALNRFPPRKGDNDGPTPWADYWKRGWQTSFELHRIFRIWKAPSDAPLEPESGDEVGEIEDDD